MSESLITPPPSPNYQKDADLVDFFRKNSLALTLQGVGVVVLLANLWLAAQLAPLGESIRELRQAQARTEAKQDQQDAIVDRFIVTEEKVRSIEATTKDIQADVKQLLLHDANRDNN